MTSIHDDDPGSRAVELQSTLRRMQLECDSLARRKDQLELVLAAGRTGFCCISGDQSVLSANSQFKAEFGWPPDAQLDWRELQERVHPEDRSRFADAIHAAFAEPAEVDLTVRTELPNKGLQWIALRGRTVSGGDGAHMDLILTSRNVSADNRTTAGRQHERATLLEQERRLREAAEAANRAKDALRRQ